MVYAPPSYGSIRRSSPQVVRVNPTSKPSELAELGILWLVVMRIL